MITLDDLKSLADKEYRHIRVSHHIRELLALQIREMREQRHWTQGELGDHAGGMAQGRVSLLEDPDYQGVNVNTLKRIGEAFDVALLVEYVPFDEWIERIRSRTTPAVTNYGQTVVRLRDNERKEADRSIIIGSTATDIANDLYPETVVTAATFSLLAVTSTRSDFLAATTPVIHKAEKRILEPFSTQALAA